MKYKSVQEVKEKIATAVESEDAFEAHLFSKYPRLFPTDESGQLLPQSQRCWNDCPEGWRSIVESLFGCIDDYVQNIVHSKVNPKYKLRLALRKLYWRRVRDPIFARFNPYRDWEKKCRQVGAKFASPNAEEHEKIRKSWKSKLRSIITRIDLKLFNRDDLYIGEKCPQVTIDQYKEKFATLRIYYSGGNDIVDGMVRYAEYLSTITCQNTGKPGQMCKRGTWYARLSKSEAKKLGYKPAEEL